MPPHPMEQKRHLRVLSKTWETDDTATFVLEPTDGKAFEYLPGQYLSLIFASNGKEERRAYSFCSCAGVDPYPAITVKRVPNGEFSNYLLQHVQPGDVLESIEPNGLFLLPEEPVQNLFFIAAGSGITPVLSQLKSLLLQNSPKTQRIVLLYANRDSRSTIFKQQIEQWMEQFPDRFECVYFFSREKNAEHALYRHLNNELLEDLLRYRFFGGRFSAADRRNSWFYLCAPVPMMRMARMTLRTLDFPDEHIRQETFMPEKPPQPRTRDTSILHHITISGLQGATEFQTYEGETILDAALRQGIALPYTCKSGVCFSCLARCTSGQVEVAFTEESRLEGPGSMVNTCIGYAVSGEVGLAF